MKLHFKMRMDIAELSFSGCRNSDVGTTFKICSHLASHDRAFFFKFQIFRTGWLDSKIMIIFIVFLVNFACLCRTNVTIFVCFTWRNTVVLALCDVFVRSKIIHRFGPGSLGFYINFEFVFSSCIYSLFLWLPLLLPVTLKPRSRGSHLLNVSHL